MAPSQASGEYFYQTAASGIAFGRGGLGKKSAGELTISERPASDLLLMPQCGYGWFSCVADQ